ncbi:MAG: 5,10-methylenetetrahydrofolate reductase [Rhodobacterales bacterium]|nr:MAG: 5,10-methylenetetrahydrofolate reductase [Rhodobacterales bacterium]
MALLHFKRKPQPEAVGVDPKMEALLRGYSIEVMPRTADKIENFADYLPAGTRVYLAHIEGVPIADMVASAARLKRQGYDVMPHFPARIIKDKAVLADWIARYQDAAGVEQALLLAGGVAKPHGDFENSMQMMETGLFDRAGFKRLHVAGHPEGNKDIDPDGSDKNLMQALRWKQDFANRTDAKMAMTTQFMFEAKPVFDWADGLQAAGIDLPIHIGIAGPAKLQTLVKFSIACGVGASLKVLQRRARDVTKLLLPFEPTELLTEFAAHKAANPDSNIAQVHFFPLGGIKTTANWAIAHGGASAIPANGLANAINQ